MRALLFSMLFLMALSGHAQIYKWVDDQGRFRYGEKPPPGVEARLLGGEQSIEEQQAEQRRQVLKREEAERHARAAKVRSQQCEKLRDELAYAEQLQLYRWEQGEKVYFSGAERKAHADKVRSLIAQHCR
ncbi:MAG: DUF4124 domain-containing protein [Betaproteobacteria bacterium]